MSFYIFILFISRLLLKDQLAYIGLTDTDTFDYAIYLEILNINSLKNSISVYSNCGYKLKKHNKPEITNSTYPNKSNKSDRGLRDD